jgi:hypothetical protein
LPLWGEVLIAAAEWGCPPWIVIGQEHPSPAERSRWFWRWRAFAEQREKKRQLDEDAWRRSLGL